MVITDLLGSVSHASHYTCEGALVVVGTKEDVSVGMGGFWYTVVARWSFSQVTRTSKNGIQPPFPYVRGLSERIEEVCRCESSLQTNANP